MEQFFFFASGCFSLPSILLFDRIRILLRFRFKPFLHRASAPHPTRPFPLSFFPPWSRYSLTISWINIHSQFYRWPRIHLRTCLPQFNFRHFCTSSLSLDADYQRLLWFERPQTETKKKNYPFREACSFQIICKFIGFLCFFSVFDKNLGANFYRRFIILIDIFI